MAYPGWFTYLEIGFTVDSTNILDPVRRVSEGGRRVMHNKTVGRHDRISLVFVPGLAARKQIAHSRSLWQRSRGDNVHSAKA